VDEPLVGYRCSTCPVTVPICAGQVCPRLCAPDDGADPDNLVTGHSDLREALSRSHSSRILGWPAGSLAGSAALESSATLSATATAYLPGAASLASVATLSVTATTGPTPGGGGGP
jgi:hypothetical protein